MDRLTSRPTVTELSREDEIQEVLRTTTLERIEAEFLVALRHGEIDGDIVFTRPPTPEERRCMGLDPLDDDELDDDE
jgi:hypothetical protein